MYVYRPTRFDTNKTVIVMQEGHKRHQSGDGKHFEGQWDMVL